MLSFIVSVSLFRQHSTFLMKDDIFHVLLHLCFIIDQTIHPQSNSSNPMLHNTANTCDSTNSSKTAGDTISRPWSKDEVKQLLNGIEAYK